MSLEVNQVLKSELTRFGERLKKEMTWPSPTCGLAYHLLKISHCNVDQRLNIPSIYIPKENFDTAPLVASGGYAISLTDSNATDSNRWNVALSRLTKIDPFPRDRQTFLYRPTELIGIVLGVESNNLISTNAGRWLQSIVPDIVNNKPHDDVWTSLLYHYAASLLNIALNIDVTAQLSLFDTAELCLLMILLKSKEILALSQFDESKVGATILQRVSTDNIEVRDCAQLAAAYAGLFTSLRAQLEIEPTASNFYRQHEPVMKKQILFLAANPAGTAPLALDEECREITQKIRAAQHRDSLQLISHWSVRPEDLLQYLNQHRPHIVHFSGHGTSADEIILLDRSGKPKVVSSAAIKQLFTTLKDNVRVVLLNACYSRSQAEAIVEVIDCAIGMKKSIGDVAAISFAAAFYQAIGFGRSIESAFQSGKTALMLEGIPEENTPELLCRKGVDANEVILFPSTT